MNLQMNVQKYLKHNFVLQHQKNTLQSVDDDVTTASKSVTNITEECEKGEGSKSITIAETDVDENISCKDI